MSWQEKIIGSLIDEAVDDFMKINRKKLRQEVFMQIKLHPRLASASMFKKFFLKFQFLKFLDEILPKKVD